jgi:Ca-activated chloride channel family protein
MHSRPAPAKSSIVLFCVLAGRSSSLEEASGASRFAAAVALLGMVLQDSEHAGEGDLRRVQSLARGALGPDEQGERPEFIRLVALARELRS